MAAKVSITLKIDAGAATDALDELAYVADVIDQWRGMPGCRELEDRICDLVEGRTSLTAGPIVLAGGVAICSAPVEVVELLREARRIGILS